MSAQETISNKEISRDTIVLKRGDTLSTSQGLSSKDSTLYLEVDPSGGIVGNPIPYSIKGDSIISAILLACFILILVSLSKARRLILRQTKSFFGSPGVLSTELPETTNELRFQFIMLFQTCLMLTLLAYIYTQEFVGSTPLRLSHHLQMIIFLGIFIAYFALKALVYWGVNYVFFDSRSNVFWLKSLLYVFSMEGIALFPLVVLHSYLGISAYNGMFYLFFVIILVRILLFYKSYVMFFRQNAFHLQIILYLCALEIMPLLLLWGTLVKIIDCFK